MVITEVFVVSSTAELDSCGHQVKAAEMGAVALQATFSCECSAEAM